MVTMDTLFQLLPDNPREDLSFPDDVRPDDGDRGGLLLLERQPV